LGIGLESDLGNRALALTRVDPLLLTRTDPLPGLAAPHVKERRGPATGRTVWAAEMARDVAPLMRNGSRWRSVFLVCYPER